MPKTTLAIRCSNVTTDYNYRRFFLLEREGIFQSHTTPRQSRFQTNPPSKKWPFFSGKTTPSTSSNAAKTAILAVL